MMKTNKRLICWTTSGTKILELVVEDTQWYREYYAGKILAELDLPEPDPEESTKELIAEIDDNLKAIYMEAERLKSMRQNLLALPAPVEHPVGVLR